MDQPFHSGWALKDLWIFAGKPRFWFLGSNPSLLLCMGTGSSSEAVTILVWLASWGNCPRQGTVASTVAVSGMLICLRAVFWVLPFPWPRNPRPLHTHRGLDYGLFLPVLSQSFPQPLGALPDSVPGKPREAQGSSSSCTSRSVGSGRVGRSAFGLACGLSYPPLLGADPLNFGLS